MRKIYLQTSFILLVLGLFLSSSQLSAQNLIKNITDVVLVKNTEVIGIYLPDYISGASGYSINITDTDIATAEVVDDTLWITPGTTTTGVTPVSLTAEGSTPIVEEFSVDLYNDEGLIDFYIDAYDGDCGPFSATLYNNSIPGDISGVVYRWYHNGTLIADDIFEPTYEIPSGYNVLTLVAENNYGRFLGQMETSVRLDGLNSTDNLRSTAEQGLCPGKPIILYTDVQYDWIRWILPNGDVKDYNHVVTHFDEPGTYEVKLRIADPCEDGGVSEIIDNIVVSESAKPMVDFATRGGTFYVCPGDPLTFEPLYEQETYSWDFGDGKTSDKPKPIHVYDTPGVYTVTLSCTNACGNESSKTRQVKVSNGLPAYVDFDYESACVKEPYKFKAFGSGQFVWDFSTGVSEGQNVSHVFPNPGVFNVSLTATNACGFSATETKMIGVTGGSVEPFPSFYPEAYVQDERWIDTFYVCPGETLSFAAESNTQTRADYNWDFGDGTTAKGRFVEHSFEGSNEYKVMLRVNNSCNEFGLDSIFVFVNMELEPDADLQVLPETLCTGEKAYFFDNSGKGSEGAYIYSIEFGDGQTANNLTEPVDPLTGSVAVHTYNTVQAYNYTFRASNICGNTIEKTGIIEVTDDTNREPFYYIYNSTGDWHSTYDKLGGADNYAISHAPLSDFEVSVDITLPNGYPYVHISDQMYLCFWGWTSPGESPPDGYVPFTLMPGETKTITAYIPSDESFTSVSLAAVAYSDLCADNTSAEPDVVGLARDKDSGSPVSSISVVPGDVVDMFSDYNAMITLDAFDGQCQCNRLEGKYAYFNKDDGMYYVFEFADMGDDIYTYSLYRLIEPYDEPEGYLIQGDFSTSFDTITFEYDIIACSTLDLGRYIFTADQDHLEVTALFSEDCSARQSVIDQYVLGRVFTNEYSDKEPVCPGDTVAFFVVGGKSYEWTFPDASKISGKTVTKTFDAQGVYNITAEITNACGRTDIMETKVRVDGENLPDAYFETSAYYASVNEPIYFWSEYVTHEQMVDNNSYIWYLGDGTYATKPAVVHHFNEPGTYYVALTVSNGCGSSTEYKEIIIDNDKDVCQADYAYFKQNDLTYSLSANVVGWPTDWLWTVNGEFVSEEATFEHTFESQGLYEVCLYVKDSTTGCANALCRELAVGDVACQAAFTTTYSADGSLIAFEDISLGSPTDWYWDFGDGQYSVLQNPEHTYMYPGTYEACLYTYNSSSGCFAAACQNVSIKDQYAGACAADFAHFVHPAQLTVAFSNLSEGRYTKSYWTFGDGQDHVGTDTLYTYEKAGTYQVCLQVEDELTGCVSSVCKQIKIGMKDCPVTAKFDYFVDMTDSTVQFIDQSLGTPDGYFWDFGDTHTATNAEPKHDYQKGGYYLVSMAVFDQKNNCFDYATDVINVGTLDCRARFDHAVKAGTTTVRFLNRSMGSATRYLWSFGDDQFSTEASPEHSYAKPGLYHVILTISDATGTCFDVTYKAVQVGAIDCSADFTQYIDADSHTAHFQNASLGRATNYFWTFGDATQFTGPNPTHEYTTPGYYTVGLTVYDPATGCMDKQEQLLLISEQGSDMESNFSYTLDHTGMDVQFHNQSIGNKLTYLWNFGDGQTAKIANPTHLYEAEDYYQVCLSIFDETGKQNTRCKDLKISPSEDKCRSRFIYTVDESTLTVNFLDQSSGSPNIWKWSFDDGQSSIEQNPSHTYTKSGYYKVHLRSKNEATACYDDAVALINVAAETDALQADYYYKLLPKIDSKLSGYPVDFIGTSFGNPAKFVWDFGDGNLDSSALSPTHYYDEPGEYEVCFTVEDPNTNQNDMYCETIVVTGTGVDDGLQIQTLTLAVYPNPADEAVVLLYTLPQASELTISVFDLIGQQVETIRSGYQQQGVYRQAWSTDHLPAGLYYLRLEADRKTIVKKLVLK